MRHQRAVVRHRCPRLRGYLVHGIVGQPIDTQVAPSQGSNVGPLGELASDVAQFWRRLQLVVGELLFQEQLQFVKRGITSDQIQQLRDASTLAVAKSVDQPSQRVGHFLQLCQLAVHGVFPAHVGHCVDLAFDTMADAMLTGRISTALLREPLTRKIQSDKWERQVPTFNFLRLQALQAVVLCFRAGTSSSDEAFRFRRRPGAGARGREDDW